MIEFGRVRVHGFARDNTPADHPAAKIEAVLQAKPPPDPPKPSGAPPASSPSEALAVPGDVPSASTPRPTLSRPPTDTLAPSVCPAPSPCPAVRPVPQASPLRQERSPSATTYDPRLTYTANQTIFHRDFGDGVVSQVEGSRIVAIFATGARMLQHAPARPSAPLPRAPALSRSR